MSKAFDSTLDHIQGPQTGPWTVCEDLATREAQRQR